MEESNKEKDREIAKYKWAAILAKKENTLLLKKLEKKEKQIEALEEALRFAKVPRNSSNSSRPPSTDIFRPVRNKSLSLREKTGRKPGGQLGHKGTTLAFCTEEPDQIIAHAPVVCTSCGKDLSLIQGEPGQTHQVVDITPPKRLLINHSTLIKQCSCGQCNQGTFPVGTEGQVNYGNNLRALVANLSGRQYMPYGRTVAFIEDIFKIHISEGTVANLLHQFEKSAQKTYEDIHAQIKEADVVGADETSGKVNGKKIWFHVYQTKQCTFIAAHPSRGQKAQEALFPGGLPEATLVSDCLAMQLATPAAAHQLCNAHLLRELKAMTEAHPEKRWPQKMSALIKDALQLHRKKQTSKEIEKIEKRLEELLAQSQENAPGKIPAFWKRMNKHKEKVFLFLHYPKVPPDNNASERAIRNVKVKLKVSGQFKAAAGASQYATIRSIIDTANKQALNVHEQLAKIASLQCN